MLSMETSVCGCTHRAAGALEVAELAQLGMEQVDREPKPL